MLEESLFHRFHTNKKYSNNSLLFTAFRIFFDYKEIPSVTFKNKRNHLEMQKIARSTILREKVIINEVGELIVIEEYPPISSPSTQILRFKNKYYIKVRSNQDPKEIKDAFYISQKKSEIFYHAVNWILPQIIYIGFFENSSNIKNTLIIDKSLHERIKHLLYIWAEFNSKSWKIEEVCNQESIKVENLKIVSSKHKNVTASNLLSQNNARYIQNKFSFLSEKKASLPKLKKIYLKREYDARNTLERNLENAQQVEELFLENSFQIIDLAKLNFFDQIKIFSNAEIIAGVHGGHFSLLAFSKKLKVIEIFCGLKSNCFAQQCKTLGFEYQSLHAYKANQKYYLDTSQIDIVL